MLTSRQTFAASLTATILRGKYRQWAVSLFITALEQWREKVRFGIWDFCIPDICHFFYTGKIFRDKILHPKARK